MSDPWDPQSRDRGAEWPAEDLDSNASRDTAPERQDPWPSGDLWSEPAREREGGWDAWPSTTPPDDFYYDEPPRVLSDPWAESWTDEVEPSPPQAVPRPEWPDEPQPEPNPVVSDEPAHPFARPPAFEMPESASADETEVSLPPSEHETRPTTSARAEPWAPDADPWQAAAASPVKATPVQEPSELAPAGMPAAEPPAEDEPRELEPGASRADEGAVDAVGEAGATPAVEPAHDVEVAPREDVSGDAEPAAEESELPETEAAGTPEAAATASWPPASTRTPILDWLPEIDHELSPEQRDLDAPPASLADVDQPGVADAEASAVVEPDGHPVREPEPEPEPASELEPEPEPERTSWWSRFGLGRGEPETEPEPAPDGAVEPLAEADAPVEVEPEPQHRLEPEAPSEPELETDATPGLGSEPGAAGFADEADPGGATVAEPDEAPEPDLAAVSEPGDSGALTAEPDDVTAGVDEPDEVAADTSESEDRRADLDEVASVDAPPELALAEEPSQAPAASTAEGSVTSAPWWRPWAEPSGSSDDDAAAATEPAAPGEDADMGQSPDGPVTAREGEGEARQPDARPTEPPIASPWVAAAGWAPELAEAEAEPKEPEVADEPIHDASVQEPEPDVISGDTTVERASSDRPEVDDWPERTQVLPTSWEPPPPPAPTAQSLGELQPEAGDIRTRLRQSRLEMGEDPDEEADARPSTAEQAVPWLIGFILLLAGMVIVLLALIFAGDGSLGGAAAASPSPTNASVATRKSPAPTSTPTGSTAPASEVPVASAPPTPTPIAAPEYGPLEMVYQGRAAALAPIYLLHHDFTTESEPEVMAQDPGFDVRRFAWSPDGRVGVGLLEDVLVSIEPGKEKRRLGDGISTVTFGADASTVYAVRMSQDGANDVANVLKIDFATGDVTELAAVSYARPSLADETAVAEAQFADNGGAVRLFWMHDDVLRLWALGGGTWEIDPETGESTELEEELPVLWSPDGRRRITSSLADGVTTLQVVNGTGGVRATTTIEGLVSHLRWSPNGERVVFTVGRATSGGGVVQNLFLWDMGDGEAPMQLTDSGAAFGAEWLGVDARWEAPEA